MKEKSLNATRLGVGILFGTILTGVISFLMTYFISYFNYKNQGGFVSFNKETDSLFRGIFSAVMSGFGGLVLGGTIIIIKFGRVKSAIIGGIVNMLIPIILIYALDDDGRNIQTNLWIYILGHFIAGGIAGLLISSFFNFSDNNDDTTREEKDNSLNIFT